MKIRPKVQKCQIVGNLSLFLLQEKVLLEFVTELEA